jgi:hypothetical protein
MRKTVKSPTVIVDPKAGLTGFAAKNRKERRALRSQVLKQERKLIFDALRRQVQHRARIAKAFKKAKPDAV